MARSITAMFAAAAILAQAGTALAASDIGVASAVTNKVHAGLGGAAHDLKTGDRVFQQQVIETETKSSAQLLFLDETALTIGPQSRVVLDRYVYDPATKTGTIVFNSTKGAFRFVSGAAQHSAYKVKTPFGTVGVRGTIWSWLISGGGDMVAVCEEGSIEACSNSGQCIVANPGEAIIFHADGSISGPVEWNGALWEVVEGIPFPLFGRRFQNDESDNPTLINPSDLNDALDNLEDRTPEVIYDLKVLIEG